MLQITAIKKKKAPKYEVYLDGEFWSVLDLQCISDNKIEIGNVYTQEDLDYFKSSSDYRLAKERALFLLTYRDHSRRELVQKLKRDYSDEIAWQIVDKMQQLGFLDDLKYAQKLAREYCVIKKMAPRRAVFEMGQKGIDKTLAEDCVAQLELDSTEILRELIARKYRRYLIDEKGIKKVNDALLRLGHHYQDVKCAVREAVSQIQEEQEE